MNKILCLLFLVGCVGTTLAARELPVKYEVRRPEVKPEEDKSNVEADSKSDQDENNFREMALQYHNLYRAEKRAEPLRLDDRLNNLAHEHAEKLVRENKLTTAGPYSQNLWSFRGSPHPFIEYAQNAVSSWYKKIEPYGGKTLSLVDNEILYSGKVRLLGFGLAFFNDYTVAVAYYQ